MKCFHHPANDAVGSCSACGKGLCTECAVDLERGLACKNRCEHEVRRIIDLRDYTFTAPQITKTSLERARSVHIRAGIYTIITGTLFVGWGWSRGFDFFMVLGILGIAYGVVQMLAGRRRAVQVDQFRLCNYCGYNLSGNTSGKCPECGARA